MMFFQMERTPAETNRIIAAQTLALQQSKLQSDGFFVTQDSSFANLVIPVIPRFNSDGSLSSGNLSQSALTS